MSPHMIKCRIKKLTKVEVGMKVTWLLLVLVPEDIMNLDIVNQLRTSKIISIRPRSPTLLKSISTRSRLLQPVLCIPQLLDSVGAVQNTAPLWMTEETVIEVIEVQVIENPVAATRPPPPPLVPSIPIQILQEHPMQVSVALVWTALLRWSEMSFTSQTEEGIILR